ncbi:MAG: monovalent cation/H+ antiporter subunit D [Rhodobacteraceae bacterium]|nr:monovalent cation/H+ antiporter subunit D [Paracoccaceae bacterium]
MNHWIIAPVLLPAVLAPLIAAAMRHDVTLARVFSMAGTVALVAISLGLVGVASSGEITIYELGNWSSPFGIVLVLDRLSAMMLLITSSLALMVLFYTITSGWDKRGRHFHALFQFQLMGISGAFLTGDAFNLFVFFEVLLIASYGLMIFGGGGMRLRAGLQYVVMNLAGSTLFLIALGTLYAVTGTLNIADLAVKVRELPMEDVALLRVAAMLLMIVFAVKAALFPVQFWLPGTYANAPAPVAAMFSIMTKVGAYAILRFFTILFGPDVAATNSMAADWLLPAALITLAIGAIGVFGAKRLFPMAAFAVLASMGMVMVAIALFTPEATTAALFYIVHSTFAAAALFLIADLVLTNRGHDHLKPAPMMMQHGLLAAMFFTIAIAIAGMPPLAGFLGKLLVLNAAQSTPYMAVIWTVVLVASLLMVVGFARAGSMIFWKTKTVEGDDISTAGTASIMSIGAVMVPIAGLVLLSVFAGPLSEYMQATAAQLFDPDGYINAVLGPK